MRLTALLLACLLGLSDAAYRTRGAKPMSDEARKEKDKPAREAGVNDDGENVDYNGQVYTDEDKAGLTADEFKQKVFKGGYKAAIIQFVSPHDPKVVEFKEDWESVVESMADSTDVFMGTVNCDDGHGDGRALCMKYRVGPMPHVRFFSSGLTGNLDRYGNIYDGTKDSDSLLELAQELADACVVTKVDECTEEQREDLAPYLKMSKAKLTKEVKELEQDHVTTYETYGRALNEIHKVSTGAGEYGQKEMSKKQWKVARKMKISEEEEKVEKAELQLGVIWEENSAQLRLMKSVLHAKTLEAQHAFSNAGRKKAKPQSKDEV